AEPAAGVGAGRPEEAVGVEREGEATAGRDGDPVHRGADLLRARRLDGLAQPELAADVAAPGPQGAVVLDGEGGFAADAGGGEDPVAGRADLAGLRDEARFGVAAELAVGVVAPGPEGAVGLHGDGVVRAGRDLDPAVALDPGRH